MNVVVYCVLLLASFHLCFAALSLTNEDRAAMLKAHNSRRSTLTPAAANAMIMQWDFELEELANDWVTQCKFEHGGLDNTQGIGQNLGASSDPNATPEDIMVAWFDEEQPGFDWNTGDFTGVGHYTQIAWADTNRVGCAKMLCSPLTGASDTDPRVYWVCNYRAAGNIVSELPYERGTACSNCPATHPTCVSNMCSPGEADEGEFGAQVFPEGSHTNSSKRAAEFFSAGAGDFGDFGAESESEESSGDSENLFSRVVGILKRSIPSDGVDPGGQCPQNRFNTWVSVDRASFSNTTDFQGVIVVSVSTQIYYSPVVVVPAGTEGTYNTDPFLFTCLKDSFKMTVYVFNCEGISNNSCGGNFGIPVGLTPAFSFNVDQWHTFDEGVAIEFGVKGDPRLIVLTFNYGDTSSNNTVGIIVGCSLIVIIVVLAVGGYIWWRRKQRAQNQSSNYGRVDRV